MKRFHSVTAFSIRFDFEKPQWVPSRQRSICEAATDSIAAWANLDLSRDPAPSGASLLSTPTSLLSCFIVNIDQGRTERLLSWKGWAGSGGQHISVYGNDQASYAIINLHRSLVIWYFIHLQRFFFSLPTGIYKPCKNSRTTAFLNTWKLSSLLLAEWC